MANNLVIQLLLKTGSFSSDLKQAKGQIQNFQKGCQTAGQSLSGFSQALGINVGALTKFGGAVGVAVAAGKSLKAIIESNQTTADAFEGVMYATKTAVNELAYAIGTFDFSNFQNGLSDLIKRAKDAHGAIDQLGNTLMSYNVAQAKAQTALAKARAGQKNPNLTKEQKQALVDEARDAYAEAREITEMALDDFENAIVAEVNARGAKLNGEGAMTIVDKFLTLDGKKVRDEVKASMKTVQKEYDKALNNLQSRYTKTTTIGGGNTGFTQTITSVDTKNNDYQRELAALNDQYKELHTYNVLLVKEQDKELEKIGQQRVQMYQLEASLYNMEGSLDMVENKINGSVNATKKGNTIISESLEYWKDIQTEAMKTRDSSVYLSDTWVSANNELDKAAQKIKEINTSMEAFNRRKEEANKGLLPNIESPNLQTQATPLSTTGLNGEVVKTKKAIEALKLELSIYQAVQEKTFDPKLLAYYNAKIQEIKNQIDYMNSIGIQVPTVNGETISTWDAFNQTMANTSTIVSSLTNTFKESSEITAASILQMVSTALPALGSLITSIQALTTAEAVEAGVAATGKAVATSKHWIEAIAAVAALSAAVASAISAASKPNIQRFANGGIVGGNSFTGDRVVANVNSGEMILNRAQQANLFKLANGGMGSGKEVEFHISGTELVGVLSNVNRKNKLIR